MEMTVHVHVHDHVNVHDNVHKSLLFWNCISVTVDVPVVVDVNVVVDGFSFGCGRADSR